MATVQTEPFNINKQWAISAPRPVIIAGPCSAESEEQVLATAKAAKANGADIIRAGIWKPRTRPNSFEGIGSIGLPWLQRVRQELDIPVTTEVANPGHVEEALKHDIDVLWIGARTTVNPFQVQEIAEALKGVNKPVMIKNPINPDVDLWTGAIERFYKLGINKLAAIHRGFSTYDSKGYRNKPMWEIPIELKRRFPDMPLICDPSHITGERDKLHLVAQKALDLDFHGLMIETHVTPDKAWSDAQQQVTPERLGEIVKGLIIRVSADLINLADNELEKLRAEIDRVDYYVLELLSERMSIAREIGKYKKAHNITVLQAKRWEEVLRTRLEKSNELLITRDFVNELVQQIHKESIYHQTKVMNEVDPDDKQEPNEK